MLSLLSTTFSACSRPIGNSSEVSNGMVLAFLLAIVNVLERGSFAVKDASGKAQPSSEFGSKSGWPSSISEVGVPLQMLSVSRGATLQSKPGVCTGVPLLKIGLKFNDDSINGDVIGDKQSPTEVSSGLFVRLINGLHKLLSSLIDIVV